MVPRKAPVPLSAGGSAAWRRGVTRLEGQDRHNAAELGLTVRRLLLVVLAAALAWIVSATSTSTNEATLALIALLIWGHFVPLLLPRKPDFFSPLGYTCLTNVMTFATILAFYATRPFYEDGFSFGASELASLLERTFIAWMVASLAYAGGYFVAGRARDVPLSPLPDRAEREEMAVAPWSTQRLLAVCALMYLVFLPTYAFFQSRVGVSVTNATELGAGKAVWREDPTLSWMIRGISLGLVPPLLLAGFVLAKARVRNTNVAAVAALALVSAFLVVRLGQRGVVVFFLVNVVCLVHYLWKRIPLGVLLGAALLVFSVGNLLGEYRRSHNPSEATINFDPVGSLADMEADRQHTFAFAVVMYTWPDRRDWLLGESFAGIAIVPIPRWLWPEKSTYFMMRDTAIVTELTGRQIPSQFPAVLYANFGWFGIVVGMFLWGIVHRRLYAWLCRNQRSRDVVILYSVVLLHFGPTLLQLSDAIQFVLPAAIAVWFCRHSARRTRMALPRPAATTPSLGA